MNPCSRCDQLFQLQPQEISPPPTANLDRSNDKVYENVTGLVKAVIEMSNRIQPAAPEEYVPMVKVMTGYRHGPFSLNKTFESEIHRMRMFALAGCRSGSEDSPGNGGWNYSCAASQHTQRGICPETKHKLPLEPVTIFRSFMSELN